MDKNRLQWTMTDNDGQDRFLDSVKIHQAIKYGGMIPLSHLWSFGLD